MCITSYARAKGIPGNTKDALAGRRSTFRRYLAWLLAVERLLVDG